MKTTMTLLLTTALAFTLAPPADAYRGWGGYSGGYHNRYHERPLKFEGLVVNRWPTSAEQVAANPAAIVALQRALKASGYYRGALDGKLTRGTRDAIMRLQSEDGGRPTGVADESVFAALGVDVKRPLDEAWLRRAEVARTKGALRK